MFDPKNVHLILIGSTNKVFDYYLGLNIIENYSFSKDLYISTVYNGDLEKIYTGVYENSFIHLEQNLGPALGALSEINVGLEYASAGYRDIIVIHNFDVHFITENGFIKAIDNFIDSGKMFSAGIDCNELVAPDCMIFRKEFLDKILPLEAKISKVRGEVIPYMMDNTIPHFFLNNKSHLCRQDLLDRYKVTTLGLENTEEFIFHNLLEYCVKYHPEFTHDESSVNIKIANEYPKLFNDSFNIWLLNNIWHDMKRKELPRLEYTPELTLLHTHDYELKKKLLKELGVINGNIIKQFIGN